MESIFCTKCGTKNPEDALFCAKCGAAINKPMSNDAISDLPKSGGLISLLCPRCGGDLQIDPEQDRAKCQHCGVEHLIQHQQGMIILAPVIEGIKRVETKFDHLLTGSEKAAAEQTIQRVKVEITDLEGKIKEKETYISANTYSLRRFMSGFISLLVVLVLVPVIVWFSRTILEFDLKPYQGYIFLGVLFIAGLNFLGAIAASVRSKSLIRNAKEDLLNLQNQLQERKQQLEQLHQFTLKT